MSVVALLQLVNSLCKNRPRRTAVFNINNGEEDGLHGAQACVVFICPSSVLIRGASQVFASFVVQFGIDFSQHRGCGCWRVRIMLPVALYHLKRVSISRPFLFRTTSYEILKAFRSASHIHADALSQDAWDQRIIRSDTDYSVYSAPRTVGLSSPTETKITTRGYVGPGGGMQGADIAFYTGRSRYHTMDDTIRGMGNGGAQKSLWSLLELLHSVSNNILNGGSDHLVSGKNERAVYFECR